MTIVLIVPIRTVSALNSREHWHKRAKRVGRERWAVGTILGPLPKPALPCIVRLTRIGPTNAWR